MPASVSISEAIRVLEHETGIVITVYFRQDADREWSAQLLRETVTMFRREVADPSAICLSADGPGVGVEIARQVAAEFNTDVVFSERNRGKFAAVQNGMQRLLKKRSLRYFVAVDQDGDHFANELLNFVRTAQHVSEHTGDERVVVLGERLSRHRGLGLLRGEQEELADRILLDALQYHAAVSGTPLNLSFIHTVDGVPDFHAGYKLFSRPTAEDVFLSAPQLAGCSEDAYYRHACEAVMTVEALLHGATLAALNRRTYDEQPVSVFASFNLTQLTADLILWPCKRLQVPAVFVEQWLANHMPQLLLGTLSPQGRDELLAIRDLVLEGYGLPADAARPAEIVRPRFI